ncbi:MAG: hypothetical protein IJT19_04085 [Bacteroidaceae bacterium]|nr:hypothetical protein [Bacteroidaceae bacterium]
MAKQSESEPMHVVIFVEGDTDEVLFKALIEHYRTISRAPIRPCRICNLKGVTRYSSKLVAKLQNEYLPEARKKGYQIQTVCCSYDTDVFEVRNPLIVNWDALRKTVKRMGIDEFVQLGIRSSIEDWLLCDMEGICHYLGLSTIPKSIKGSNGNAKLNDLYGKARRIYQKGYQVKELVASLDMSLIRKKNVDALAELEKGLNVTIQP